MTFSEQISLHICSEKGHAFVPFGAIQAHFGARSDIPGQHFPPLVAGMPDMSNMGYNQKTFASKSGDNTVYV